MRRSYSLSSIVVVLALLSFFLIIVPLSYVSYTNFEKTLSENISNYLDQVQNSAQTLIEHEAFIIENKAIELSNIISNVGIGNLEKVNMDSSQFSNEIDLLFVSDGNETYNYSVALYDTDLIIKKLLNTYNKNNCVNNVLVEGEVYSLMVLSKDIINTKTGRVEGQVFVGKILNDNMSFLEKIKNKIGIEELSLTLNNKIIATTYAMEAKDRKIVSDIAVLMSSNNIYNKNKKILSQLPLSCNDTFTGLNIVPVIKSDSFDVLKENNTKQIVGWILFFALINLVMYLMVNNFIVDPTRKLLEFAKNIKETKCHKYEMSVISEYNVLANGLEDIISELRDIKEQYTLAVEGTQEGLWDWNISENKIFFSARCKEMLGYEEDELELDLDTWKGLIHEEDKSHVDRILIEHLKQKVPVFEVEFRVKCKGDTYKWFKAKAKAIFSETSRAHRMLGFFSDIDMLKKLEEENQQKEAYILEQSKMSAMGDMLSNIAHQWRQPLSVITTIVSGIKVTLELDLFDKNDIIKDLDVVSKTSQNLSRTIDTFRETYEYGHKKEDFNLKELVLRDIQMLEPAYSYQNICFVTDIEDMDYYGYKDELLLVFNKLLQNSKDALLKKEISNGLIFVRLRLNEEQVLLEVKDNAGGIEDTIKEKIFEPYFTTKHQSQGVGLSLYMSRNIMSKYFKGTLAFENEAYDYEQTSYIGATFTLSFPLK